MDDLREQLERERRRHRMPNGSLGALERRRERKQRNRRMASGVVALLIAAAGVGGALYAFRLNHAVTPAHNPTPSPSSPPSPSVRPSVPAASGVAPPAAGAVQFLDDQHGWAVVDGAIETSSDGGATWLSLGLPPGSGT